MTSLCFLLPTAWFLYKGVEVLFHHRSLRKVVSRIHVLGTRGKSQTVRLILAGLRSGGIKAVGRITGEIPTLFDEKGNACLVPRRVPARISEYLSLTRWAAQRGAEVLVSECMAIRPELIRVTARMIRPQITVLTNIRPDHCDVWGAGREGVAASVAAGVVGGKLFALRSERIGELWGDILEKTKTELLEVPDDYAKKCLESPPPLSLHLGNLSLALKVCEYLGVEGRMALRAMLQEKIPNSFGIWELTWAERRFLFANAFTANDPHSTRILLERALTFTGIPCLIGLFNNRSDRLFRVSLFADFVHSCHFSKVLLLGDPIPHWSRWFPGAVPLWGKRGPEAVWERALVSSQEVPLCFGFGNFKGMGAELVDWVQSHGRQLA